MRWFVQDSASKLSDEELVSLAQKGDNAAIEILLTRYQGRVRAAARRYFLAGGEAEDLIQEGMIGVHSAIVGYDPNMGKSFKNYAYLCIKGRMLDAVRLSSRQKHFPLNHYVSFFDPDFDMETAGGDPEADVLSDEERSETLLKISRTLSDFEFRIFSMYLDGFSYAQICEATGKPFRSVGNAISRAKKKLQKAFTEN